MTLAPIILFAYNRPEHTRKTLEALEKNDMASESILYVYSDGPKTGMEDKVAAVREVVHRSWGFKELHIVESMVNKGLAQNIVGAVTEIVNQYGRVITLEDDVVTSKGFLRYMNDALEVYKDDEKVMHISAYMYPNKACLPTTFFFEVPYPGGGWATWKRAWSHYDDNTEKWYAMYKDNWSEFNKFGGKILQEQLEKNYSGRMKTWFIKWHAALLSMGGLTLYPCRSLTQNIGFDGSGVNSGYQRNFDIPELVEHIQVKPRPIKESKKGSRVIYDFYQGHWYNKRRRTAMLYKILKIFGVRK